MDKKNRDRSARSSMHRDDTIDRVLRSWKNRGKSSRSSRISPTLGNIPLSIDNSVFSPPTRACIANIFQKIEAFFFSPLSFFFFFFPRDPRANSHPGAGLKSVEREREGKGAGVDNDMSRLRDRRRQYKCEITFCQTQKRCN